MNVAKNNIVCLKLGVLAALVWMLAASAMAHNMPSSAVFLDFYRDRVGAELMLPLAELEPAFKQPLTAAPGEILARYHDALKAYVLEHVTPETEDGQRWSVKVQNMEVTLNQQPVDLVVKLWMKPPAGATTRKFKFNYSVINHEVMSHNVYVSVRNDWDTAVFSGKPEPLGNIHFTITSLMIDRSGGNWWQGFCTVFNLGVRHIAEGTDHLLFLLVLLLAAPLVAKKNRWGEFGGFKASLVKLLKIVSAFTLGHSLTLALGAAGAVRFPARPIEIVIAVSIFVSAVHALRPWLAGRELLIAGGFGLIHGLAFAGGIAEYGFSRWYLAGTVLGFNLGIEAMQLVVIAVTMPWLLLLARTKVYPIIRVGGALFAGAASLGWIAERAFSVRNPVAPLVNALAGHPIWILSTLAMTALFATYTQMLIQFTSETENAATTEGDSKLKESESRVPAST